MLSKDVTKATVKRRRSPVDHIVEKMCQGVPVSEKVDDALPLISDSFLREWSETEDLKLPSSSYKSDSALKREEMFSKVNEHSKDSTVVVVKRKSLQEQQVDLMVERLCRGATVSDQVENLCRFKCPKCEEEMASWRMLTTHCGGGKKCAFTKKFTQVESLITKVVSYICKICSSTILCDGTFTRRHLFNEHKILLSQYIVQYGPKRDKTNSYDVCQEISAKSWYMTLKAQETDRMIEKLCEGAPVSAQATSLCTFKCHKCNKILYSWGSLSIHFGKHSSCHTKLGYIQLAQFVYKIVCHICQICSTKLICDGTFIVRHLGINHQISLNQYIKNYKLDSSKTLATGSFSDKILGDLCVYKCQECQEQFNSFTKLVYHQRSLSHKISSRNKECRVKSVYHKCKLCNKFIHCEIKILCKHMRCHGMNLEEYCNTTGCIKQEPEEKKKKKSVIESLKISNSIDNLCVFACSKCKKTFNGAAMFHYHKRKRHECRNGQTLMQAFVKGFSFKCSICPKLMFCDKTDIRYHMEQCHDDVPINFRNTTTYEALYRKECATFLKRVPVSSKVYNKHTVQAQEIPIGEITSAIGNLCTFSCLNCNRKNFSSYFALKKHIRSFHQEKVAFKASLVMTARYHSCLLCPKAVLNDRHILMNHLHIMHQITLSKYEKVFQKHGGKTLPSYQEWLKAKRTKFVLNNN